MTQTTGIKLKETLLTPFYVKLDSIDTHGNSKGWAYVDHGPFRGRVFYGVPGLDRVVLTVNDFGETVWVYQQKVVK